MAKKDQVVEESKDQAVEESKELITQNEEKAIATVTPAMQSLIAAIEALPPEKSAGIMQLAETLNPKQEGFGEMEDLRYRPPVVKVKQAMTTIAPKAAVNGDLYSSDTGEIFTKPLEFIPLYPYENRARFPTGSMKPDCRSEDCKTSIYGDDCSKCPDRPWKDNQQQKCNNSVNIIAASLDFSKLYHLQFSKTSSKAGTAVLRQSRNAGQKPFERVYHLDTDEVKGGQGVYYTLSTSFAENGDPIFYPTCKALHDVFQEQRVQLKEDASSRISDSSKAIDNLDDDVGTPSDENTPKGDFTDL